MQGVLSNANGIFLVLMPIFPRMRFHYKLVPVPGTDPGEGKWANFHTPPLSEPPSFFFSFPSNIELIFDFSDIFTKIHPPFQNPGSTPESNTGNTIWLIGRTLFAPLMPVSGSCQQTPNETSSH